MDIEFLVEDESTKTALRNLLPKMLPRYVEWSIRAFQGKHDLLAKLPTRLRGYRRSARGTRFVVLIDRDLNDCHRLKERLENIAINEGYTTKSQARDGDYRVLNRIVIEELEAWFFGDNIALSRAFPGVSTTLARRRNYRIPDEIQGTWERLEKVLKNAGYYETGLNKREAADLISKHMNPGINISKSFKVFRSGLNDMVSHMDKDIANGVNRP